MYTNRKLSQLFHIMAWLVVASLVAAPSAPLNRPAPFDVGTTNEPPAVLSPEEAITAALAGVEIGPDDFRISYTGGDTDYDAFTPKVAYNPMANEYLVVWSGDNFTVGEYEIYGQRIDAATGAEVGENDFRISNMGPDNDPSFGAFAPAVAYNSTGNEYLVVWHGDYSVDHEYEIYGQRLAADGTEIGANDFRISDMGPDGNIDFDAIDPAVAYNSTDNEYLVVWMGDDVTNEDFDIYAQRLTSAGVEIGTNDFRISDMGPDGNVNYRAHNPALAYNSTDNGYLVVWWGDDSEGTLVDGENEIFGQRLAGNGIEVGANDFRISRVGADQDTDVGAFDPAVAYNSTDNEYLVVWTADPAPDEFEIYGQLLDAGGIEIGVDDFRISEMGPEGDVGHAGYNPDVAYNSTDHEYLVLWSGNDPDLDYEIHGQRLTANGAETGPDDFRISDMGPDADFNYFAYDAIAAYNPTANQYLVVWQSDDEGLTLLDDEYEIFGQLLLADGTETGENDFRISNMGGDTHFYAEGPEVAYNSADNEFMVVWSGQLYPSKEYEIMGQRVNAATGELIGGNFRISDMGPDGMVNTFAFFANIAYNSIDNEYLVVWSGIDTMVAETEIYGQRLDAAGAEIGDNDFRISVTGPDGDADYDAYRPKAVHNSVDNEYLVVWDSDHSVNNEIEVYGQRLDANGAEIGGNDIRLTHMGPDGNTSYQAVQPKVAHNPDDNQYLLVWTGNETFPAEVEIYGRLLDNTATPQGMGHFRLSTMGPDGDTKFRASEPQVVYNPVTKEYLAIWHGDDTLDNKIEIYGQRLSAAGVETGADDFAISATGPANDIMYFAASPALAVNPNSGEYLAGWRASRPGYPDDVEIFAQRLGPNGNLLDMVAQLSEMGPEGDMNFIVENNALAYNSQDDLYLSVWYGSDDRIPMIYTDVEIFGQLYGVRVDLGLSNTDAPAFVAPQAKATYTITATNSGPDVALGPVLTAALPTGVTFVSASGPGWTCGEAGGMVTCEADSLDAGAAVPVSLVVTAPAALGPYTIAAAISSGNTDLATADNSLELTSQVTPGGQPLYPLYLPITRRP